MSAKEFFFDTSQPYYKLLGSKGVMLRRALRQKNVVVDVCSAEGKTHRWVARGKNKVIVFSRTMSPSTVKHRRATNNKSKTKEVLGAAGIKVPAGVVLESNSFDKAVAWFNSLESKKAVVKPIIGSGGRGITSSITSREQLERAYKKVSQGKVVLEEHIDGADHRILVLGGKVIAAMRRWPAHVTGDGIRTIKQLVDDKNEVRKKNPYNHKHLIKFSDSAIDLLEASGYTQNSVLDDGETAFLQSVANIGAGGDGEDVTDIIHPDFIAMAEQCSKVFSGVECVGVDLIADDISLPASRQKHAVIELNVNCDITIHHWPSKGKAWDVASAIADYYFPDDEREMAHAVKLIVEGRVKNVGYLKWVARQALFYGVNGYCKSVGKNAVEVVLEGSKSSTESMMSLCAIGSDKSLVRSVDAELVEPSGLSSFSVV